MRRGLVAASAALVLLVACDRNNDDPSSPTPSAAGGANPSASPSPSSERAAALQFRPVQAVVKPSDSEYTGTTVTCGDGSRPACTARELLGSPQIVISDGGSVRYLLGPVILDGNDVAGATAVRSPFGGEWAVSYRLTPDATKRFTRATERAVALPNPRNAIAIVVDGRVVSATVVQAAVHGGLGQIAGISEREAKTLADRLGGSVG